MPLRFCNVPFNKPKHELIDCYNGQSRNLPIKLDKIHVSINVQVRVLVLKLEQSSPNTSTMSFVVICSIMMLILGF